MKKQIALQLYSLRTEFEEDYKNTLERVSDLGFDGVEFAGFYGIDANEMKETLDEYNLKAAGSHTSYELLLQDLEGVMAYNKAIGNKHIICPMCFFPDEEALDSVIHNFDRIGKRLMEEGFVFSYHNHSHEFEKIKDTYILDTIFERSSVVIPELDVYWVYRGNENPVEYIKKYSDKLQLLHLKDGTMEEGTALFEGSVDIKGVLDSIADLDIEWLVVEDETPYPNSFASVERSIENLKASLS